MYLQSCASARENIRTATFQIAVKKKNQLSRSKISLTASSHLGFQRKLLRLKGMCYCNSLLFICPKISPTVGGGGTSTIMLILFCYYMFFEIINSLQKMNLPYVYTQPFSIWLNGQFLLYRFGFYSLKSC